MQQASQAGRQRPVKVTVGQLAARALEMASQSLQQGVALGGVIQLGGRRQHHPHLAVGQCERQRGLLSLRPGKDYFLKDASADQYHRCGGRVGNRSPLLLARASSGRRLWALSRMRMLQEPIRIIRQPAGAPLSLIDMS